MAFYFMADIHRGDPITTYVRPGKALQVPGSSCGFFIQIIQLWHVNDFEPNPNDPNPWGSVFEITYPLGSTNIAGWNILEYPHVQ